MHGNLKGKEGGKDDDFDGGRKEQVGLGLGVREWKVGTKLEGTVEASGG